MDQIAAVWKRLDLRRQIAVVGATATTFALILLLGRGALQPDYALLYAGLDPSAAGEVIAALESQSVPHRVLGGMIEVPSGDRDRLRMALAADGLPRNGASGYELLDGLSGFGTTSQMFDAAYLRAKEGELARTLTSSPSIRQARVHLSGVSMRVMGQDSASAASVFVTPALGQIGPEQARALRYLVASAVAGLTADAVSIIDGSTGRLVDSQEDETVDRIASDRAAELRRNVLRLLEAQVGVGRVMVEVNVETITERENLVERKLDPQGRVAISTESTESTRKSSDGVGGSVSVASNLPDGGGANSTQAQDDSETRQLTNFEVSETTRQIQRAPGGIRRLTVAVLVGGQNQLEGEGTFTPRTEEELAALEALVSSAVGFNAERGDRITIKSLPMEPLPDVGGDLSAVAAPSVFQSLDFNSLVRAGLVSVVALVLGLFVVRPLLTGAGQRTEVLTAQSPPMLAGSSVGNPAETSGSTTGIAALGLPPGAPFATGSGGAERPVTAASSLDREDRKTDMHSASNRETEVEAAHRLKALIEERREEAIEVLRGWIEGEKTPSLERAR